MNTNITNQADAGQTDNTMSVNQNLPTKDKVMPDKTSENKTAQDKTSENNTPQDKATENNTPQNKTSGDKEQTNNSSENKTLQNNSADGKSKEDKITATAEAQKNAQQTPPGSAENAENAENTPDIESKITAQQNKLNEQSKNPNNQDPKIAELNKQQDIESNGGSNNIDKQPQEKGDQHKEPQEAPKY